MSEAMNHGAAEIIQQLLIDLGLASDIGDATDWPVFEGYLPDKANQGNVICVYNMQGNLEGITVDLEMQQHEGFNVAIRSDTIEDGESKGRAIFRGLIRQGHNAEVVLNGSTYKIHGVTPTSDLIYAGMENPTSRRRLFTINAITAITMTSEAGTGTGT